MKGQVAIEFMWFVGMGLIILMIFIVIISDYYQAELAEKDLRDIEDFAKMLQDELLLAVQAHEGYERSFRVPNEVSGVDIEITTYPDLNVTVINFENQNLSFKIPSNTDGGYEAGKTNKITTDKDGKITISAS